MSISTLFPVGTRVRLSRQAHNELRSFYNRADKRETRPTNLWMHGTVVNIPEKILPQIHNTPEGCVFVKWDDLPEVTNFLERYLRAA